MAEDKYEGYIKLLDPIANVSGFLTSAEQIDAGNGKSQAEINALIGSGGGGVKNIQNFYAKNNTTDLTPEEALEKLNWVEIPNAEGIPMPIINADEPYLWTYEIVHYNDGTSQTNPPHITGVYGDGKTLVEIRVYYLVSASGTESPDYNDPGWVLNGSEPTTKDKPFLWRKDEYWWTGDTDEASRHSIYLVGVRGEDGVDGDMVEFVFLSLPTDGTPDAPKAKDDISRDSLSQESIDLGWSDEPKDVTPEMPYIYMSRRKKLQESAVWGAYETPRLWAIYGKSLLDTSTVYATSSSQVYNPDEYSEEKYWSDSEDGKSRNYSIHIPTEGGETTNIYYSIAYQGTDEDGNKTVWANQAPSVSRKFPYLWRKTLNLYTGNDERTVYEVIGVMGERGLDSTEIEYIYKLTPTEDYGTHPGDIATGSIGGVTDIEYTNTLDDFVPLGWTDTKEGISGTDPFLWESKRERSTINNNEWLSFGDPVLVAVYGRAIKSVTRLFHISTESRKSVIEKLDKEEPSTLDWYTSSPPTDNTKRYLWEKLITEYEGSGTVDSSGNPLPAAIVTEINLIGKQGDPGIDGDRIDYIFTRTEKAESLDIHYPAGGPKFKNPGPIDNSFEIIDSIVRNYAIDIDTGILWYDEPPLENEEGKYPYLWASVIEKPVGDEEWGQYSKPKRWTTDGTGILKIETTYTRSSSSEIIPGTDGDTSWDSTLGWKESSPELTETYKYLWKKTVTWYNRRTDWTEDNEEGYTKTVYDMIGVLGQRGIDGNGVDYIFTLTSDYEIGSNYNAPTFLLGAPIDKNFEPGYTYALDLTNPGVQWYDDAPDTSEEYPFLWCSRAKSSTPEDSSTIEWGPYSKPRLWSKYGSDGKGILKIESAYLISNSNNPSQFDDENYDPSDPEDPNKPVSLPEIPEAHKWYTSSPEVSDEFKFLWRRMSQVYDLGIADATGDTETPYQVFYEMIGTAGGIGIDGAGREWAFKLTKEYIVPISKDSDWPVGTLTSNGAKGTWTDDALDVDKEEWPYLWVISRTKKAGDESYGPWGIKVEADADQETYYRATIHAIAGVDGIGIEAIRKYYIVTTEETDLPDRPDETTITTLETYKSALLGMGWKESWSDLDTSGSKAVWELELIEKTGGIFEVLGPACIDNPSALISTVYKRSDSKPTTPSGGSYTKPVPEGWSDGIPGDYTKPLWSSWNKFFWGIDTSENWSEPVIVQDTVSEEKVYSANLEPDRTLDEIKHPIKAENGIDLNSEWEIVANGKGWYDDPEDCPDDPFWEATCTKREGIWSAWSYRLIRGEKGKTVTVREIITKYAIADSYNGNAPEGDKFSTVMPTTLPQGKWLWTWTKTIYDPDGEEASSYSVTRIGIDGNGVESQVTDYYMSINNIDPESISGWGSFPTKLTEGAWLYTRTRTKYTGIDEAVVSYTVTQLGTGSYYAGLQEYYAVGKSENDRPTGYPMDVNYGFIDGVATYPKDVEPIINTEIWKTTRSELSGYKVGAYLWNFTISRDSGGTKYVTEPHCIGNLSKGIASIIERYCITATTDTPDINNGSIWTDEVFDSLAIPTPEKRYQWNWTRTTYNDGTSDNDVRISCIHPDAPKFRSFVFTRYDGDLSGISLIGGTYTNPIPRPSSISISDTEIHTVNWSDGIPSGTEIIWSAVRDFIETETTEVTSGWSSPKIMADSPQLDVDYSDFTGDNPGNPSDPKNGAVWYENADQVPGEIIWMATRTKSGGLWGSWAVAKIKGEDGAPGTLYGLMSDPGNCTLTTTPEDKTYGETLEIKVRITKDGATEIIPETSILSVSLNKTGYTYEVAKGTTEWILTITVEAGIEESGWVKNIPLSTTYNGKTLNSSIALNYVAEGESGRGISKVVEYYCLTKSQGETLPPLSSINTTGIGGWVKYDSSTSDTVILPKTDKTYRYLWNREGLLYTDGNWEYTPGAIVGIQPKQVDHYDCWYKVSNSNILELLLQDDGESSGNTEITREPLILEFPVQTSPDYAGTPMTVLRHTIEYSYQKEDDTDDGWRTNSPSTSDMYPYLWRKSITVYDDGTSDDPVYECISSTTGGHDTEKEEFIYVWLKDDGEIPETPRYPYANGETVNGIVYPNIIESGTNTGEVLLKARTEFISATRFKDDYVPEGWHDDYPPYIEKGYVLWQSGRTKSSYARVLTNDGLVDLEGNPLPSVTDFRPMWGEWSIPQKVNYVSVDGADGVGIQTVEEFYQVTTTEIAPTIPGTTDSVWKTWDGSANHNPGDQLGTTGWIYQKAPQLDQVQRYLWNFERTIYTDGTFKIHNSDAANIGQSGKSPISMVIEKSTFTMVTDATTGNTAKSEKFTTLVRLFREDVEVAIGTVTEPKYVLVCAVNDGIPEKPGSDTGSSSTGTTTQGSSTTTSNPGSSTGQSGNYTITVERTDETCFSLIFSQAQGVTESGQVKNIIVHVYDEANNLVTTGAIGCTYVDRGLTGSAGKTGPLLYPAGSWEQGEKYTRTSDTAPFVYYEGNQKYYILETEGTLTSTMTPDADTTNWAEFTQVKYIFTEALMAKWARLGRSVFYGDHMFSVQGIAKDGSSSDYSVYGDVMFENTGTEANPRYRLTGDFTPNLFMDFLTGEMKVNKLNEPFQQFKITEDLAGMTIDEGESYNVSVQAYFSDIQNGSCPGIVCMPNPTAITTKTGTTLVECPWYSDGANSTIIYQPNDSYINWVGLGEDYLDIDTLKSSLTILCADGRILNQYSYRQETLDGGTQTIYAPQGYSGTDDDHEGYFVINGCYSKFILLAPGEIVKLKQCLTRKSDGTEKIYWYVENQTDFKKVQMRLLVSPYKCCDESTGELIVNPDKNYYIFDHTSTSGYYYGTCSAWASNYVSGRFTDIITEYSLTFDDTTINLE